MICGAKIAPRMATPLNTTRASVRTRSATIHASSRPCFWSHSTNTGTKTDVRIPPSTSSYTMFGVVLAVAYVLPSALTPSAAVCADSRRYPVIRDSVVPTDMTAVSRTNAPRWSSNGIWLGSGSMTSDVGTTSSTRDRPGPTLPPR